MKEPINTTMAPTPAGAYSQGMLTEDFVFVAGQGPVDVATGAVPEGIEGQTHQTLRNVRAVLEAGGVSMDDVVKSTVHLADIDDFVAFDRVYREYFREPFPVRTTVGSQLIGILVEVDVIAKRHLDRRP